MQYFNKILAFRNFRLLSIILLICVVQKANSQAGATSFENTNAPDPFNGTFYNGGNPVFTISPSDYNKAYCIDRTTPVCDGTKLPLSPGTTNTNNQLAYATYLLSREYHPDDVKRELVWAVTGQTNSCSANSECASLMATVQALDPTTPMQLSVTPNKPNYELGEKIILTVVTNVSVFNINEVSKVGFGVGLDFCDATGNPIPTPSGADIGGNGITYPVTNTPSTFYLCTTPEQSYNYQCFDYTAVPTASDVSIWSSAGCQTLAFLINKPLKNFYFEYGSCASLSKAKKPTAVAYTGNAAPYNSNNYQLNSNFVGVNKCGFTNDPGTYAWTGPNGFTSVDQNPITPITQSGTYIVTVKVNIGTQFCKFTDSVYVVVCPTSGATITVSPSIDKGLINGQQEYTVVDGSKVTINALIPAGATNIKLQLAPATPPGSGFSTLSSSLPFVINNFDASKVGTYYLVYRQADGCTVASYAGISLGPTPKANLSLQKIVSKANPMTGDQVVYTVKITNAGPDIATNVVLKDILPAGLTFVSVSTPTGTYNATTGLWTIGTVPLGMTSVTMTVNVN